MKEWLDQDSKKILVTGTVAVALGSGIATLLLRSGETSSIFGRLFRVMSPLIWGFVLAYLLAPSVRRIENLIGPLVERKKQRPTLKRAISLTVIYLILLCVLVVSMQWLLPELIRSVMALIDVLPNYARYLGDQITQLLSRYDVDTQQLSEALGMGENWLTQGISFVRPLLSNAVNLTASLTGTLSNFFIGLVASIYMLAGKEKFARQFKKLLYAFLPKNRADSIVHWTQVSHRTVGGFIGGKILDSTIVGVVCYLFMLITKMPYALIISVIIGVTNLVPFFGPLVGAVIASIIMILVTPGQAIWFILFAVILQQIDGNLLGPAILGDSIGLSPFWVMAAIVVGGKLFGFAGMLLSIPLFAVLYAIVRSLSNARLREKGLPVDSSEYENYPPADPAMEGEQNVKPGYIARLKAYFSRDKAAKKK